jgi:hypothetical protein
MPANDTILSTDSLRVVFTRQRDRVSHSVELFDKNTQSWLPILESIEGAADNAWPASPPLQQLHIEKRGDHAVALMVGMAGAGHWSASIETLSENRIRFDLACRTGIVPSRLQSAYRIAKSEKQPLLKIEPHSLTVHQSNESELIFAPQNLSDPVPVTFRWGYDLSVQSP